MKINSNKIKSLIFLSLVGSGLGKDEKSNNQSGILNDNQFPEIVANLTNSRRVQEGSVQYVYIAGAPIMTSFKSNDGSPLPSKKCTGGFAIIKTGEIGKCEYNFGFLTSVLCAFADTDLSR